jgi:hypothetical protein
VTTSSSTTLTFAPSDDTYVQDTLPTSNFGTATGLRIKHDTPAMVSLIKFTVTGVGSGHVTGATLRLFCTNGGGTAGLFYATANTWSQGAVTWNSAPAAGALVASPAKVPAGAWLSVDVSSLITADGTYSLRIESPLTNNTVYSSKEGANPPQLVVNVSS